MPSYVDSLKAHLADYKHNQLGVFEDGLWSRNSQPYPHILPLELRQLNIVAPIRAAFWEYAEREGLSLQLHRDFHHLNSSQALAFNLFFPFVALAWSQPQLLLAALGLDGKQVASFGFEVVPDPQEGTNFDFLAIFSDDTRLFVEVKLAETEFGRCEPDARHEEKRQSLYVGRLADKVIPTCLESPAFFSSYQLLRNLSHLSPADTLILLVPRANRGTFEQAHTFIADAVMPRWHSRVHLVALEELIEAVSAPTRNAETIALTESLREKYLAHGV